MKKKDKIEQYQPAFDPPKNYREKDFGEKALDRAKDLIELRKGHVLTFHTPKQ
jgi:hypothetical protein